MCDDPEVEGTVPVESADVVRIWRTYKALGEWALPYLGIEMSPDEARETIDLIYELEVYNNQLRNQHTDPKTGGGTRLIWIIGSICIQCCGVNQRRTNIVK